MIERSTWCISRQTLYFGEETRRRSGLCFACCCWTDGERQISSPCELPTVCLAVKNSGGLIIMKTCRSGVWKTDRDIHRGKLDRERVLASRYMKCNDRAAQALMVAPPEKAFRCPLISLTWQQGKFSWKAICCQTLNPYRAATW